MSINRSWIRPGFVLLYLQYLDQAQSQIKSCSFVPIRVSYISQKARDKRHLSIHESGRTMQLNRAATNHKAAGMTENGFQVPPRSVRGESIERIW